LHGLDSLLSIVQMPAGIPVGTLAIGRAGAVNAALLAASILANKHPAIRDALLDYRNKRTQEVLDQPDLRSEGGMRGKCENHRGPRRRTAGADAGAGRLSAGAAVPLPRSIRRGACRAARGARCRRL